MCVGGWVGGKVWVAEVAGGWIVGEVGALVRQAADGAGSGMPPSAAHPPSPRCPAPTLQANEEWSLFCPNEAPGLADCWGPEFEALYAK